MPSRIPSCIRAALLLALLVGATACETTPVRSGPVAPISTGTEGPLGDARSGDELMQQAATLSGTAADRLYLAAGIAYLNAGNLPGMNRALAALSTVPTGAQPYLDYAYLEAAAALHGGNAETARGWLDNRKPALAALRGPDPQQEPVAVLRAAVCRALDQAGCAASALMSLTSAEAFNRSPWFAAPAFQTAPAPRAAGTPNAADPALAGPPDLARSPTRSPGLPQSEDPAQRLHDEIWRQVTRTAGDDARARGASDPSRQARGWWALRAALAATPTLAAAPTGLDSWRQAHPGHNAQAPWPRALAALTQAKPVRSVAVLLPLSGPLSSAGEAVRNGFVATALAQGNTLQVRFFDSAAQPMAQSYEAILNSGAEAIIGPLAKQDVDALAMLRPELPVLTLNYLSTAAEQALSNTTPLQLGLAIEDEADTVVARLEALGLTRVLVLHGEQDWARRAAERLRDRFADTATIEMFDSAKTVTEAVGRGMFIDNSHLRSQQIFREIGTHIEFSPRARDDLDAVVALVDGTEAQVLVPALKFHFGNHLPVFATGQAARNKDTDALQRLRGFQIAALPWHLGASALAQEVRGAFDLGSSALAPLYALGSDAYRIAAHLPWLNEYRAFNLNGESGALNLSQDGRIHRELAWGVVSRGQLQPLPRISAAPAARTQAAQQAGR
jgi:outer membrane PBP1 activator LpoA protein